MIGKSEVRTHAGNKADSPSVFLESLIVVPVPKNFFEFRETRNSFAVLTIDVTGSHPEADIPNPHSRTLFL